MLWQEHPCRTWAAMNKASKELRPQHLEQERRGRAAAASTPLGGVTGTDAGAPHTHTHHLYGPCNMPRRSACLPRHCAEGDEGGSALPTANTAGSSPAALCKQPTLAGLGPGCGGNLSPRSKPSRAVNLGAQRRGKQQNPALNVRVLKCTALLKDCVQSLFFFIIFFF